MDCSANAEARSEYRRAILVRLPLNQSAGVGHLHPMSHVAELARIPGVRLAVPIGQHLDKSDSGFGTRLIEGIPYGQYAALNNLTIKEGRGLQQGNEVIVDSAWQRGETQSSDRRLRSTSNPARWHL
jgi:hypothetical protein